MTANSHQFHRIYPHSIQFLSYQPSIESFVSILKQTQAKKKRGEEAESERRRLKSSSAGKGDVDRERYAKTSTAKKQETRRGRIPTDSGARYRVTFVMVSAETSTSQRYTPVGTGRETLPATINRPSTRWNESTTNLIFSRA